MGVKPPHKIKVGLHVYRVRVNASGGMTGSDSGVTDHHGCVVHLDTTQALSMRQDTLLHETLHAVLLPYNMDSEAEEKLIRFLAPALLTVLRENPKLTQYLLA